MKKSMVVIFIVILAFVSGYSLNNNAVSVNTDYKIAVVDVQELVANSNAVKKLKKEQENKIQNIQSTLDKARIEMSKEKDMTKLQAIEQKYRDDINKQKSAMESEYNVKFSAIDKNIKNAVIEKARAMNYNIVLPKNMVLLGGDDITNQVASAVK